MKTIAFPHPRLPIAGLLLALAACDFGSEPDPDPPRPAAITISPESATLSSLGETATFTARITDQHGADFSGTATWSTTDATVFAVSSQGVVTANGNGSGTLTATFQSLSATASVVVEQVPAALTTISGDAQEGLTGDPLAEPLVVRVDDAGGSPVEGVAVTFTPAEAHGSADPATAETDTEGLAQTTWTLGADAGSHTLTTSLDDGMSIQFTASAQPRDPAGSAVYQVVFEAMWSDSTHPNSGFPGVPHFSPLIGAVHSDQVTFWELGDTASPGMEDMAEKGGMSVLAAEIDAEIPDNALAVVTADGLRSPGSRTIERVVVHPDYPLVTLVTMLGPSPDWFAGIASQSLLDDAGEWIAELRIVLYPLDAGTDSGTEYTSANEDTSPKQPIRSAKGEYPFSEEPVGTFIFTHIDGSGGP